MICLFCVFGVSLVVFFLVILYLLKMLFTFKTNLNLLENKKRLINEYLLAVNFSETEKLKKIEKILNFEQGKNERS